MISHHHNGPKQFKCEKCSARFSTAANLKAHMQGHEGTPDSYCQICKEVFFNDAQLKAHVNKHHFKLKQMKCEQCNKSIEESDLLEHMKIHMKSHRNGKSYVCEVCNSVFMQKGQFNVHMRMHTRERPYQCRVS